MTSKKRTWGQFATPTDLTDLLLGFCLRRSDDRLLDPSCGDGLLLRRAAQWRACLIPAGGRHIPGTLYGVELDPDGVAIAETVSGATIIGANFFSLNPNDFPSFDAIVGNPPYTRAEWIERLDEAAGQLALFPTEERAEEPATGRALLPRELGQSLGGRAGLYAYFFLHSLGFLREGGRLGFVVPNGWLDVAYGRDLKQFLLDHFRIIAIIESAVERWFSNVGVNTCMIILERSDDPAARGSNLIRLVSLRRTLGDLVGGEEVDARQVAAAQLASLLLPPAGRQDQAALVRVSEQRTLAAKERWGPLLRAPEIMLRRSTGVETPLSNWAGIHRGFTTGDNRFFYLTREQVAKWAIEPEYYRPLLKSLRGVHNLRITEADCQHVALTIPESERLEGTAVAEYLAWGEARGVHHRASFSNRRPWYALQAQSAGALLLAKGVWQRHFTALATDSLTVDQQVYRLEPADGLSPELAAALLNSAWFALQCEIHGRVNLGEGVLWLATYELSELPLPDPRVPDHSARRALEDAYRALADEPLADMVEALDTPARRALDDLVFDLLELTATERTSAREALVDCLNGRRLRTRRVEGKANKA